MRQISTLFLYLDPLTQRHGSKMHHIEEISRRIRSERPATRFAGVQHLHSGETVMLMSETVISFEDRPRFGPAYQASPAECSHEASPAAWLGRTLERVSDMPDVRAANCPLMVSAPLAALLHNNTAMTCDAAIRRTPLKAEDIFFDVNAATLTIPGPDITRQISALRNCGFKVSLDVTRNTPGDLSPSQLALIDTVRIDARQLDTNAELNDLVETADAAGIMLIAEQVAWRDAAWLRRLGIEHAIRPRADA